MPATTVWEFLNMEHPVELRSKETRRQIRSHVTRRQHEQRRAQPEPKKAPSRPHANVKESDALPSAVFMKLSDRRLTRTDKDSPTEYQNSSCPAVHRKPKRTHPTKKTLRPLLPAEEDEAPPKKIVKHNAILAASLADPGPFYLDGSQDPFNATPVPYKPWYGWLTDYWYKGTIPRGSTLLKTTDAQIGEYSTWSRRLEMTEPAAFYMMLLVASGIPVANGSFPIYKALWLRDQTIRAINDALCDPDRACSTALILAVGLMALHEHIYGDRETAHKSHRPAQQRMIALRGGLEALGLPLVTIQVMVWYDRLMSAEAGNEAYFADIPDRLKLQSYNDEEAIRVTNYSSPARYSHPGYGVEDGERLQSLGEGGIE